MSRALTAADRSALIRLASTMEKGSDERRAVLAGLCHRTADDAHGELELVVGQRWMRVNVRWLKSKPSLISWEALSRSHEGFRKTLKKIENVVGNNVTNMAQRPDEDSPLMRAMGPNLRSRFDGLKGTAKGIEMIGSVEIQMDPAGLYDGQWHPEVVGRAEAALKNIRRFRLVGTQRRDY